MRLLRGRGSVKREVETEWNPEQLECLLMDGERIASKGDGEIDARRPPGQCVVTKVKGVQDLRKRQVSEIKTKICL